MTETATQYAYRVLGAPSHSLNDPKWVEVQVINPLRYVYLLVGNDIIWSGIIRYDDPRFKSLMDEHPSVEIIMHELTQGVHY